MANPSDKRVTGLGGVFFKAHDPKRLVEWYSEHLGLLPHAEFTGVVFEWREQDDPEKPGSTVWGAFPENTDYFAPSSAPFMINYRVADLDRLLAQLRAEGVAVDDRIEETAEGRFGWISDPEGNRIELWQPAPGR